MANKFWVGGTGDLDGSTTTHISNTTGGGGGATYPAVGDTLIFDGASGGGTVTVIAPVSMAGWTSSAHTGTIDTNGQTLALGNWTNNGNGVRTVNFGASAISVNQWLWGGTNLTFNPGTSVLTIAGSSHSLGGKTYATAIFTAAVACAITDSSTNTFGTLTRTGGAGAARFTLSGNLTVTGAFTPSGNNSTTQRLVIESSLKGIPRTINAAVVVPTNADFQDIVAAGAASWNLAAATGLSGDCQGNSGITFTPAVDLYWQHGAAASYNVSAGTTRFFLGPGGTGGAGRSPLPQDRCHWDNQSFSATGKTVSQDLPRIGSCDWTGVSNSPTLQQSAATSFFGDHTLDPNMTVLGSTGAATLEGRGSHTLYAAGHAWGRPIIVASGAGDWTFLDDVDTSGRAFTISSGHVYDGGNNITASILVRSATATASLNAASNGQTWEFTDGANSPVQLASAGFTYNRGTETIRLTGTLTADRSFIGAGLTFYDVVDATAGAFVLTWTGSNSFHRWAVDCTSAARSWKLTAGTTQTYDEFQKLGANGWTLDSTTTTKATMAKSGGGILIVDNATINHIIGSPALTFFVTNGSDGGSNTTVYFVTLEELAGTSTASPTAVAALAILSALYGVDLLSPSTTGVLTVLSPSAPAYSREAGRQVVLVEATPSLTLRTWTLHSGAAYKTPVDRFFGSGDARLYRRVVGVRQNDTDLTAVVDVAAVVSTAGSYFWDEAAGQLYVQASTGVPTGFTVQAFVTYFFATEGRTINQVVATPDSGIYYRPWVVGDLPRITRQVSDLLFGLTLTEVGDLQLLNGHGAWNALIPGHNWKNKRILFLLGHFVATALERPDFEAIATMLCEDLTADEETAVMKLAPAARKLDAEIPATPFMTSSYPNLGEGVSATRKWIGYGQAVIRPDLTDNSGNGVWTIADAAYQTLFAVNDVVAIAKSGGARVGLTQGVHYTVDLTLCTVTIIDSLYGPADYEIEVDVVGKPDGAGSYLKTFGQIVRDILTVHVGVPLADLDTDSFTTADVDAPEALALWTKEPRSIASIVSSDEAEAASLERSVLGQLKETRDGKWNVHIWSGTSPGTAPVSMRKEDFVSFKPDPKIESVVSIVRVHYAYDHSTGTWQVETAEDPEARYLSETRDSIDAYTYLTTSIDALTLAQRLLALASATSTEIEFEERASKLATTLPGEFAIVTFSPAPVQGGAFVGQALELLRLDISLSPTLLISGRLGDLRSISDRVGHWTDDSAPDWDSASDEERSFQGFWADDDGLVDPLDPMTEDESIWW